jgi:hypothetical protein
MPTPDQTTIDTDNDLLLARRWKNLIFLKDGRTVLGYHEFSTEAEAAQGCRAGEELLKANPDWRIVSRGGSALYFASEYSHCVQVPYVD